MFPLEIKSLLLLFIIIYYYLLLFIIIYYKATTNNSMLFYLDHVSEFHSALKCQIQFIQMLVFTHLTQILLSILL